MRKSLSGNRTIYRVRRRGVTCLPVYVRKSLAPSNLCVSSPAGRTRMIDSADLDSDKEEATGQSLRVVVIDDEPVIAHTLGMILREKGYDTVSYTNPLTALKMVPDYLPHIVVTDVTMPQ